MAKQIRFKKPSAPLLLFFFYMLWCHKTYLQLHCLLDLEISHAAKILPRERQGPINSTQSVTRFLDLEAQRTRVQVALILTCNIAYSERYGSPYTTSQTKLNISDCLL